IQVSQGESQDRSLEVEDSSAIFVQSEDHLKRNYSKDNHKKSTGYVKKDDEPSFSGSTYDHFEVMMMMSVEALLDWIIDSVCS
ncbi:hypothetical protein Tco_0357669, partial [Tanacetum coccineum]